MSQIQETAAQTQITWGALWRARVTMAPEDIDEAKHLLNHLNQKVVEAIMDNWLYDKPASSLVPRMFIRDDEQPRIGDWRREAKEMTGYRFFRLFYNPKTRQFKLYPMVSSWKPGYPEGLASECDLFSHESPEPRCRCGHYAVYFPEDISQNEWWAGAVRAQVLGFEQVQLHSRGFRAKRIQLLGIFPPLCGEVGCKERVDGFILDHDLSEGDDIWLSPRLCFYHDGYDIDFTVKQVCDGLKVPLLEEPVRR